MALASSSSSSSFPSQSQTSWAPWVPRQALGLLLAFCVGLVVAHTILPSLTRSTALDVVDQQAGSSPAKIQTDAFALDVPAAQVVATPRAAPALPEAGLNLALPTTALGVQLELPRVPFFLHDDDAQTLVRELETCSLFGLRDPDVTFVKAARNHPWRTRHLEEARFFIISIPVSSSWYCGKTNTSNHDTRMKSAIRALVSSEAWQKTRGKQHLWLMFDWHFTAWADAQFKPIPDDEARGEWADHRVLMADITVMNFETWNSNPSLCKKYGPLFNDYCHSQNHVWMPWEYWGCTVVIPYLAADTLTDAEAQSVVAGSTFTEWLDRPTTIFFQEYAWKEWNWGRTPLRRAGFDLHSLPGAHVGYGLPPVAHLEAMTKSKFCMAPRGDTPSTHKVYDAIRALCFPVIISDLWHQTAKPFPLHLAWDAFVFFIPEGPFVQDPKEAVAFLYTLPQSVLEQKFRSMLAVRDVLDWRSPSSKTTSYAIASAYETCSGPRGFKLTPARPIGPKPPPPPAAARGNGPWSSLAKVALVVTAAALALYWAFRSQLGRRKDLYKRVEREAPTRLGQSSSDQGV